MQTKVGAELLGEALEEPTPGPAFERLLHGLLIALHHYADRSETIAGARGVGHSCLTSECRTIAYSKPTLTIANILSSRLRPLAMEDPLDPECPFTTHKRK